MPYVSNRWLGGTLTITKTISKSIKKLENLEEALKEENIQGKEEVLTLEDHMRNSKRSGWLSET